MIARFVIGRDGKVSNVSDQNSDIPDAEVRQCVLSAFYDLEFPQPEVASSPSFTRSTRAALSAASTMNRLVLIALTLAAFAPSARAEPVKAPARSPSVQVRDLAVPNHIELPVARRVVDLPAERRAEHRARGRSRARGRVAAGSVQEAREASSPRKLDELFSSLKVLRERWKVGHPGAGFPGVAVLWLGRSTPAFVTRVCFRP